jgi:hypothetical protein
MTIQSFNEKMKVNRLNDYILLVLRTNDYTELTTCTHCNPVVINNYVPTLVCFEILQMINFEMM